MSTKTDARKLDGATQAHLGRPVVKTVRGGMTQLNTTQARRVRTLIVGKRPDRLKLPFYLWTREGVAHERAEAGAPSVREE